MIKRSISFCRKNLIVNRHNLGPMRILVILCVFILLTVRSVAQTVVELDSDKVHLKQSADYEVNYLDFIERGDENSEAFWVQYDRRPGIDPWITESLEEYDKYGDDNFIEDHRNLEINILASITTYDNCGCAKTKMSSSLDMFLINFKIQKSDLDKMKRRYGKQFKVKYLE